MASRGVLLKALFNQFYTLATELQEMFPEDPDFAIFEKAIRALEKTNPGLLLHYQKTNVLETPIGVKIEAKDESFFLEQSYAEQEIGVDVIGKLKQQWAVLSEESKTAVWAQVQAIHTIATRLVKSD